MPKIRWTNLPPSLRQHLFDRVADRQIPAEDLYKLKLWRESEPEAPDGPWYKDFGSFKVCGEGEFPKTFLLKGQAARGKSLWTARCPGQKPRRRGRTRRTSSLSHRHGAHLSLRHSPPWRSIRKMHSPHWGHSRLEWQDGGRCRSATCASRRDSQSGNTS